MLLLNASHKLINFFIKISPFPVQEIADEQLFTFNPAPIKEASPYLLPILFEIPPVKTLAAKFLFCSKIEHRILPFSGTTFIELFLSKSFALK